MTLAEAAAEAEALVERGDERALAELRTRWDDEVEHAARSRDYRERAVAYRAIAQFRYRQKTELLRRGLEDESPACRGSALLALESLSREHPGVVNGVRALLHELAARDGNEAVRRLALVALRNGSPDRATIQLLEGLAGDDEQARELRDTAAKVAQLLRRKGDRRR
ncbi:MAG TPA: HEAT repeat domain-containing protein [Gaiellaceae bacterium]|nr:HEAT repeat domain-containing protein [Gaiellaceae bacterium]